MNTNQPLDTAQVHGMSDQSFNRYPTTQPQQPSGSPQQAYMPAYIQSTPGMTSAVGPSYVLQQQVLPTRSVYPNYLAKTAVILGWLEVVGGILSIIFNSVGIGLQANRDSYGNFTFYFAHGIWCGIFYIICGGFTLGAAKKKSKCLVITSLVLSIIVAVVCWNQIGCSIASIAIDAEDPYRNYDYRYPDYILPEDGPSKYPDYDNDKYDGSRPVPPYYNKPESSTYANDTKSASLAMGALLLILGLMEFVAVIWTSTLACRVLCCVNTVQTPQYVQYPVSMQGRPQMLVAAGLPSSMSASGTMPTTVVPLSGGVPYAQTAQGAVANAQGPMTYGLHMNHPPPYEFSNSGVLSQEKQ